MRAPLLLMLGVLLSCDTNPPGGADGPCAVPGYDYVQFEELVLNLPRYSGAKIVVDGYVRPGPRRCRDEAKCDCSADPLFHDGYERDTNPNEFLLAPGADGKAFAACEPGDGCKMNCTPGPSTVVRIVGTLSRVVEDEGEAVINVVKACEI